MLISFESKLSFQVKRIMARPPLTALISLASSLGKELLQARPCVVGRANRLSRAKDVGVMMHSERS